MSHLTYLIVPVSELPKVDFARVLQTSAATCKCNQDKTRAVLKWAGKAPDFVASLAGTQGPFTHEEITDTMQTPEWATPSPRPAKRSAYDV